MNEEMSTINKFLNSPVGNEGIKLIECPRDAMQGWKAFIPTEKKIEYINCFTKSWI